jgi:hypothetical protein
MVKEAIFVEVSDEGTSVFQRIVSEKLSENTYKVGLPPFEHDPDDLILKFPPGAVVRCVLHEFHGGEFGLLAIEEIPSP